MTVGMNSSAWRETAAGLLLLVACGSFPAIAHVPNHCLTKADAVERTTLALNDTVVRGALEMDASMFLKTEFNEALAAQQFANRDLILCIAGL